MVSTVFVKLFVKGRLKYPAKALCSELFYKIEEAPLWNPTILESKIVRVCKAEKMICNY